MLNLPISALPNQEFQVVLDQNSWDISIKATNGIMAVSLTLNNNIVIQGARAVAGALIIQSQYLESGNFFFITQNYELPDYTQFGITQSLIYVSAQELAAYRATPSSPIITAAYFNPIASLPLRFAPQNYTIA